MSKPCNYEIAVCVWDPSDSHGIGIERRPCRLEMGHEGRHMFDGQEALERLWAEDEPDEYAWWLQRQTKDGSR